LSIVDCRLKIVVFDEMATEPKSERVAKAFKRARNAV